MMSCPTDRREFTIACLRRTGSLCAWVAGASAAASALVAAPFAIMAEGIASLASKLDGGASFLADKKQ